MRRALPSIVLALCGGCGPIEPSGTLGALHEFGFWYYDVDSSGAFPPSIGVGSGFSVSIDDPDEGLIGSDDVLTSSNPAKLEVVAPGAGDGEEYHPQFRALASGTVNIQARDAADAGSDAVLVDYVTVHLADVARLEMRACDRAFNAIRRPGDPFRSADCVDADSDEPSTVVISRGTSLAPTFCVVPQGLQQNALGGYFEILWEPSPAAEQVLEGNVSESNRCATIGGLKLGIATVTAHFEEHTARLDVRVDP